MGNKLLEKANNTRNTDN